MVLKVYVRLYLGPLSGLGINFRFNYYIVCVFTYDIKFLEELINVSLENIRGDKKNHRWVLVHILPLH